MPDLQTSKKYLLCKKQLFDQYYEKLNDNEIAVRASADTEMMKVVQNLLTLNKDGSFKIPNDEFDATWASMLSSYKGIDVYNKLTDEYNNKFNN